MFNSYNVTRPDRTIANQEWMELFWSAAASYLHKVSSDHSPLIICLLEDQWRNWSVFKYDQRLFFKEGFKEEIVNCWREARGRRGTKVMDLIRDRRKAISGWKRRNRPNSAIRIREFHHEIDLITRSIPLNHQELNRLMSELNKEYRNEELF